MNRIHRSNHYTFLLIAAVFIFSSCHQSQQKEITAYFVLEQEVMRISVDFDIQEGAYFSYLVVNNDTIRMKIDTGATNSYLSFVPIGGIFHKRAVMDANGIIEYVPFRQVEKVNWGGLEVRNLWFGKHRRLLHGEYRESNIIGNDILHNFCVQFDNKNREIVLTANSSLIERRGIAVPLRNSFGNTPKINLIVNGKKAEFIIDSGFTGEIAVDSAFFHSSGLSDLKTQQWLGGGHISAFALDFLRKSRVGYVMIADCVLGERLFKNVLVSHSENLRGNYIGTSFFRRFRSVTIDNFNNLVYFELPDDLRITEEIGLVFSDEEITIHPIEYLYSLFKWYNSFGFSPTWEPPFTIHALEINSAMRYLAIGDTLVGINQTLFSQRALDKITPQEEYELISTRVAQREILLFTMHRATEAIFHFLRNDELVSINAERKRFLYPAPYITYAFQFQQRDLLKFGNMNFFIDPEAQKMSVHFPWKSLSGREIEMQGFNDEGSFILNNRVLE